MSTPQPGAVEARPDVALYLPSLAGGGAERVMLDLASALADAGLRIELVLASRSGRYLDDVPPTVRVVDLRSGRVASSALPLVRYLWRRRPRSLLSTLEHANVLALLARGFAPRLRVVVREANTVSAELRPVSPGARLLLWLMRRTYPRADAVVAVSRGVAEDLRAHLGVREERLHVIHNPVVTPRVLEGAGEAPAHPWFARGEPPVVLAVGRLAPQKGFDTLLHAFRFARERVACRLVILGEGDERGALEALAAELGVADDVDLPGFVTNPFAYMARAGTFVLSSAWEGLPNVLIQAMALGTPCVSTDCPSGPDEITDGGRLAPLVPVGDARAMGEAIAEALARDRLPPSEAWLARYHRDTVAQRYARVLGVTP